MTKPLFIARQSAHPTGLLGHVVANVMARDTAAVNDWVLAGVEPKPGEAIVELGCGHGRTLQRLAEGVGAGGWVVGVDPSEVMRRTAARRNRREIAAGRVAVVPGDSGSVAAPNGRFDKWVSVHSVYFWPDLPAGLGEAARLLRPGGELFLAFHSGEDERLAAELPGSVYTLHRRASVERTLADVGFGEITSRTHEETGVAITRTRALAWTSTSLRPGGNRCARRPL